MHAIVVAAGEGRRAGLLAGKKQFANVGGHPVILHTLTAFQNVPLLETLVCVIAREDCDRFNDLLTGYPQSEKIAVVEGGACRQESVAAGLSYVEKFCAADDIVVVHDGVRPLVSPALIERVIQAAITHGGAAAALPVTDSLKVISESFIQRSLPREAVWGMQTPQAFRFGLMRAAMNKAIADGFIGTDEAALMERMGYPVFCVEGSPANMKITTRFDLQYVEILLKAGGI